MRNAIFLTVLFLFSVIVSPVQAEKTAVRGTQCYTFGTTTLDTSDGAYVVACLATEATTATDCTKMYCMWKAIGETTTNAAYIMSEAQLQAFHKYCQNKDEFFITCSSACSRFCTDACDGHLGYYSNCDHGKSNLNYSGGAFMGWYTGDLGKCLCYNQK